MVNGRFRYLKGESQDHGKVHSRRAQLGANLLLQSIYYDNKRVNSSHSI